MEVCENYNHYTMEDCEKHSHYIMEVCENYIHYTMEELPWCNGYRLYKLILLKVALKHQKQNQIHGVMVIVLTSVHGEL
jgi:rRNA maturation protein Nop10